MKSFYKSFVFCFIMWAAIPIQAQDWDDFDPPPPVEYGGPQPGMDAPPPPPPPPSFDTPQPTWDNSVNIPPSRPSVGGGSDAGLGPVRFKKTGKKRDLSKSNARKNELLKEDP